MFVSSAGMSPQFGSFASRLRGEESPRKKREEKAKKEEEKQQTDKDHKKGKAHTIPVAQSPNDIKNSPYYDSCSY